jgi:hypothetical protein
VGREDAVEAGEVRVGRRHEGHEATHEGCGGEDEGAADLALRCVLVAPVIEATEPGLGDRPASPIADEALEALPVVAVHRGVGVQREAHTDSDASATR